MEILKSNSENIQRAVNELKSGSLVAFPTETVYGLGADGLNKIAVSKIFEAKERPSFNPLILHISSIEMLNSVADYSRNKINLLIDKFWPGPLTLILKKKDIVPYIVTAGLDTVAVRMPKSNIALELIKQLGKPIAAPSANTFSKLSPTKAEHVAKQLGKKVNIILDGGSCDVGVESTIIEVNDNSQFLLRPGGITKEEIESVIGELQTKSGEANVPNSPGQLHVHYAPNIPLLFYDEEKVSSVNNQKLGGIFFSEIKNKEYFKVTKVLSPDGDFREAASNLFAYLHEFENLDLDMIIVEPIEKKGLGIAIMDRLTKAVNKYV
jgi:L-threonylcarbamoyladenylate synthase